MPALRRGDMGIPEGDPEKGKKLFMQRCAHCHTVEAGGKQTHSPNLRGIVGRRAGSSPGYNDYTEANKNISKPMEQCCYLLCAPVRNRLFTSANPLIMQLLWPPMRVHGEPLYFTAVLSFSNAVLEGH